MTLLRADHLGMCFGVRDAIALAESLAASQPTTVLGELVHNPAVIDRLRSLGVQFESRLNSVATSSVIVTAHGASDQFHKSVAARGWQVSDATCPLVRHAHRALATLVRDGYHPVVIGQPQHVEVRGMTEDYPGCDVVQCEADIHRMPVRPRYGVVSQTTQPIARVLELVQCMRKQFPESKVLFRDTVCQPTKQRQSAAEGLARCCTVVIVIGGAHSNNTRELVATCRRYCTRVYHVQGAADLQADWFFPNDVAGITAGTSTPDATINEVEARLMELRNHLPRENAA